MDFHSAVKQLIASHAHELNELRHQMNGSRATKLTLPEKGDSQQSSRPGKRDSVESKSSDVKRDRNQISPSKAVAPGCMLHGVVSLDPPIESFAMALEKEHTSSTSSEYDLKLSLPDDCDRISLPKDKRAVLQWEAVVRGFLQLHDEKSAALPTTFKVHEGWESVKAVPDVIEKHVNKMMQAIPKQDTRKRKFAALSSSFSRGTQFFRTLGIIGNTSTGNFSMYAKNSSTRHLSWFDSSFLRFIMHPAGLKRRLWVSLCMIVIIYEVFALTMSPFDCLRGDTANTLETVSAIFWVVDIVVNFFSGIYLNGKVEVRFTVIAKAYLRTWFLFDIVVATTQLLALIFQLDDLSATFFLRIIRAVRSLRVARVFYWLKEELGLSSSAIACGKLLQFWVALYFFIHCSACVWFALGKSSQGWVGQHPDVVLKDSWSQNYLVSLHWSLSQLQGNIDVYPGRSTGNRLFAVISSACSIVALTFFVSSATDTLFEVRQQEKRRLDVERLVNGFFARHVDIDPEIRARAEYYLNIKQKQQSVVADHEQDSCVLDIFPDKIRSLLLAEIRSSCLIWHPCFAYLHKFQRNVFVRVCSDALSMDLYEPNDDVFVTGERSKAAHFILHGQFVLVFDLSSTVGALIGKSGTTRRSTHKHFESYRSEGTQGSQNFEPMKRVSSGQLISEISLWIPWVHVGGLCSKGNGQVLGIGTQEVISILQRHPTSHTAFASYAACFVDVALTQLHHSNSGSHFFELMSFDMVQAHMDVENGNGNGNGVHPNGGETLDRNLSQFLTASTDVGDRSRVSFALQQGVKYRNASGTCISGTIARP